LEVPFCFFFFFFFYLSIYQYASATVLYLLGDKAFYSDEGRGEEEGTRAGNQIEKNLT
jgi:hypothetical protein